MSEDQTPHGRPWYQRRWAVWSPKLWSNGEQMVPGYWEFFISLTDAVKFAKGTEEIYAVEFKNIGTIPIDNGGQNAGSKT